MKIISTGLAASAALMLATDSQGREAPVVDANTYTHPNQLIRVDGRRRLNMLCMGVGGPTVILDSGAGAGLWVWAKVQARIAAFTRVCSYDRAGYGFSDPVGRPADIVNAVDDMHRLLRAAGISDRVVLVGHSRAGFDIRLYASRYPKDVVGLVFIDPISIGIFRKMDATYTADQHESWRRAKLNQFEVFRHCIALAEKKGLSRQVEPLCFDDVDDPVIQAELDQQDQRPATLQAEMSEMLYADPVDQRAETPDEREMKGVPSSLGARPTVVIHAIQHNNEKEEAVSLAAHREIAAWSTRGALLTIESGHNVAWDHPDFVVQVVRRVVDDARA